MVDAEQLRMLAGDAGTDGEVSAPEKVVELGNQMAKLKDEIDVAGVAIKELKHEYDDIRNRDLPEAMEAAGMVSAAGKGSFTLADGRKVHLRTEFFAYVRKLDKEEFFDYLRELGQGDLVKEDVHAGTVRAWAKEQVGLGVELPAFVQTNERPTAIVVKR